MEDFLRERTLFWESSYGRLSELLLTLSLTSTRTKQSCKNGPRGLIFDRLREDSTQYCIILIIQKDECSCLSKLADDLRSVTSLILQSAHWEVKPRAPKGHCPMSLGFPDNMVLLKITFYSFSIKHLYQQVGDALDPVPSCHPPGHSTQDFHKHHYRLVPHVFR